MLGQGPSGSSKHSTNVNNSLRSTSTSSLNSIGLSTTSTSTTATTKSSKSALKKANLTGSNDHFDTGNFRESHESLDIKQIATSLYAPGGGSGAAPNTIQSTASVASSSTSLSKHQRRGGGGGATRKTTERDQFQYINSPQLQHQQQSASMSLSMPIEQHLASSDDGSASCYSSSMRDLLSTDHFADDNTFTGTDEFQHQQLIHELQENLEQVTRDKSALEAKLAEMSSYKGEVLVLQSEITKLQMNYEKAIRESQQLIEENESLRNRLRDVVNSPLSDAEKQQIIDDSQRLHSSAPASIALPNSEGEGTSCLTTPDWDKHSSSSEVSVACLQDKIIQMEETHYSTNEELQATLQELADLQAQLSELQSDNDRLVEEKDVLFQSLCRQTEKLEDSRNKIVKLQELLLRDSDQQDTAATTEREQKLLDLLKNTQEEREAMFMKQEELQTDVKELRASLDQATAEKMRSIERINQLESTVDAGAAERKQLEAELAKLREAANARQIDISRLSALLENARSKIDEFEQERAVGNKTDLHDLLDTTRKEKDALEGTIAVLHESLSKSQCEVQKLQDQVAAVNEECKVTRNNAKCALSDLEYKFAQMKEEKTKLSLDLKVAQDSIGDLEAQCGRHVEEKAQLEGRLAETKRTLGEKEQLLGEKEDALSNERKLRKFENEEWKQFQSDLLMTVRVANDFKTEAQMAHEQLVIDNKMQRDRIRALEQENMRLTKTVASQDSQSSLLSSVVQQEMAQRRQRVGISRQDSRLSVKSLIESIEKTSHVKSNGQNSSQCSSSSSINSLMSDQMMQTTRNPIGEWSDNGNNAADQSSMHSRTSLTEKQVQSMSSENSSGGNGGNGSATLGKLNGSESTLSPPSSNNALEINQKYGFITGERKDPLSALVKNGGSKRNALLKWCQNKTVGYRNIDITNFSSSWNDGLAFCAILHSYLKDKIPYDTLGPHDKRRNFTIAFSAAESVGIHTTLNINTMCQQERPDWQQVLAYVTAIYKHFES